MFCSRQLLLRTFTLRPRTFQRQFSFTPIVRAAEDANSFLTAAKNTRFFRQLADKPEALSAMQDFAKLLKDNGIDMTSGKTPSRMQIFSLAANSEFRAGAQRLIEELKKAGVDLTSKDVMEEIMNLKGKEGGDKS